MKHLLVTNDFPPKIGGIQSYLWELWRRLDPDSFVVLTTPYNGDQEWDSGQPFRVVRSRQKWLLPTRSLISQINELTNEIGADLVVLDPVFPLGVLGPKLNRPFVAIAHGAEYVIPGKIPLTKTLIDKVTNASSGMVASGEYVADAVRRHAKHDVPVASIPPGVDPQRFTPADGAAKAQARAKFGVSNDARVVVGVSRLVPRKGFDRLIEAAATVRSQYPNLEVLIAGSGRDSKRLEKLIDKHRAPVRLLGRVPDVELPHLYAAADVFCMPCHDRWFGLEREGFGIVFVEAGAAGICSVAGVSGGSGEAVGEGETGLLVGGSVPAMGVARALGRLFGDDELRLAMSVAARRRAEDVFSYELLAARLGKFLESCSAIK